MPIRWRLTIFIALVIGVILLLLGVALFFLNRNATMSGIEDTARTRAITAAQAIDSGEDLSNDEEDIEQLTLDGVFVIVRDGGGNVLTETVNLPANAEASDTAWRRALDAGEGVSGTVDFSGAEDSVYVYAVPVEPPSGPARVVEAGKSYESAKESVEVFRNVLAGGIAAAFLLSIGGAYFLARAALRPVDAVVSAAREMSEDDLTRRLPVANHKDEIGRLATTINGFLSRLEAAFARREEALSRQRRFAADASHELRTPLTAISGHAWMLDEWAIEEDPKKAKESASAIRREARRMRSLVEELLALTRGDEGPALDVGHHDLAEIAEEAVQAAEAAANGKVTVEYAGPERGVEATFDKGRILQVAGILLDNAVKYTPEGGSVIVRAWEKDGRAALEVSDTGTGIPEDQLPLVFERFHRVDPSRTEEGAGLGLSIARQIAESHGGEIEARSVFGEGSTFVLLIPKANTSLNNL
ncbi:MAG: HAMP domain-containing sensor histidine kinase [Rubrobacteraceae bacterium]